MLAVTGIPIVDCATGTCVPCSGRSHSRRTFSSRRRCTSTTADRRSRSLGSESFTLRHHYLLLPDSSISIKGSSDNLRPSLSVRDNAESSLRSSSARLFGGLSVRLSQWEYLLPAFIHIGKFADFPQG